MANQPNLVNEYYEFKPVEEVTLEDMQNLFLAINLTLHEEAWARLPEETRRHFIVRKRAGEAYRYGKEPKAVKPMATKPAPSTTHTPAGSSGSPQAPKPKPPARPLNAR